MRNLREVVESVIRNGVPGDIVETGVWRGGAMIYARGILRAYGVTDKRVFVCDSFQGLPPPNPGKYPVDAGSRFHRREFLSVSLEQVQSNFAHYELLDDQVVFVKGFFENTIATAPIDQVSVLRLDGDMYSSTIVVLDAVYPKLSPGGFLIVDDWALKGARSAVQDYREKHGITDEIIDIDGVGAYWQKTK